MAKFVLDASAVLAFIQGEAGSDEVEACMSDGVITSVNLAEVITRLSDAGLAPDALSDVLVELALPVAPVDEELALAAGQLRRQTRHLGLSLADRICLAFSRRLDAKAVTGDRAWVGARDLGFDVQLFR